MPRIRLIAIATSAVALGVSAPALALPPGNDNFGSATALAGSSAPADAAFTTAEATKQTGEPYAGLGAKTIWFRWTPNAGGAAYADVCPGGSHGVRVYRVQPGQAESLATLEVARTADGDHLEPDTACRARWRATGGTKYFIQVRQTGATATGWLKVNQDTSPPAPPTLGSWPATTKNHQATFSSSGATGYVCATDGAAYKACQSPHWLAFLPDGAHTFRVRALDGHGNLSDPTVHTWTVDATGPTVTFTAGNGAVELRPTMTWTVDEPGATAYCSVDGGGTSMCSNPWLAPMMLPGEHRLEVFAKDAFGNVGPTAVATWTVPQAQAGTPVQNWQNPATIAAHESLRCKMRLLVPARTTRARLRRGLKVRLTADLGRCSTTLVLEQGTRRLASRRVTLASSTGADFVLKTKVARRGTVTVSAGGLSRTVRVR
jgi:hypothetical protein